MGICMAGIDFSRAALEQREAMAFTKSQAAQGMQEAIKLPGVSGCVLVSTCNRTELWLCSENERLNPAHLLCDLKGLPYDRFSGVLTLRRDAAAVRNLFETACGLHSLVWGEDQIIAQIKDAASLSMQEGTAGKVLSKLFQTAVTSAKEVKTQVRFPHGNSSVAAAAVRVCEKKLGSLHGLRCLIIGSGNMGCLSAAGFADAGADVCITLRRYRYGISEVPDRCATIPYDRRMEKIAEADIVVSVTASPHYTLTGGSVAAACAGCRKNRLFLDLAVPRDIDPAVGRLPGCTVLTVDDVPGTLRKEEKAKAEAQCREIIDRYIGEFERQQVAWSSLSTIETLSEKSAFSLRDELLEQLEKSGAGREECQRLADISDELFPKRFRRALFSLRDWMEKDGGPAHETIWEEL